MDGQQHPPQRPFRKDLNLVQSYYQAVVDDSVEYAKRLMGRLQDIRNEGYTIPARDVGEIDVIYGHMVEQHLECIRTMAVKYIDASALLMTQTMLASDARSPELSRPLWVQPLAPLPFRKEYLIRAICLYNPYDPDRAIKLMQARDKGRPGGAVGILRELSEQGFAHHWCVDLLLDRIAPTQQTDLLYTFLRYDPRRDLWEHIARNRAKFCQDCQFEVLGDQQIHIPCPQCAQDLAYWSRWLKTLLWTVTGKFRKPSDAAEAEATEVTLMLKSAGKKKDEKPHKAVYHTSVIRYDASYFRAAPHAKRGPLSDTHLILSHEEALREGAMEVDLDGVLIHATTYREGFTRHFKHPRFKIKETTVKPKEDQPVLISLRTWKERERQKAERLQQHQQMLVYASEYQKS